MPVTAQGRRRGRTRAWLAALVGSPLLSGASPAVTIVDNPGSGLRTWEVGAGARSFVLLHGYGATVKDWLPFTETIHSAPSRRFIFPAAPETTEPPDGPAGAGAWWRLDLASYIPRGGSSPDLARAHPAGLVRSATRVQRLLDEIDKRLGSPPDRLVFGGFSQGAMIAADIAFRTDRPLQALVLLSATPVDEAAWTASMSRRRGLRVFISHGRHDPILPFASAERLAHSMRNAGLQVTWLPFDDGHEIPSEVVAALNGFLESVGDE